MTTEPRETANPFPGLRPFETEEYRLFFGREGQSDELVTRLGRARFLAVVGTSGSGKSSLVRAGLLPALRGGMLEGSGWRVAIMRPGGDPVGNLAQALAEDGVLAEAGGGLPRAETEAVIEATLRRGTLGLVDAVRKSRLGGQEKLLVIADQFEELFRFRAARAASSTDDAAAFVKLLIEAARQRELNIYVILTMRSDFLGDCSQFQGLPEAINDGQYLIPRMTRDERRAAIVGPVRVARARMSEALVNRLLNDVGDNPDQLPILQHALMRTWEHWAARATVGEPIGLEHYEAVGTMSDALSRHADEAFNELPDERGRQIAELLFKALTERGADNREIRRPTRLSEVCDIAGATAEEVSAVVEVFRREGRSFLMPPVGVALNPDTVLDISHESLIRNWERLKKWVDEEAQSARSYRRLAEAAALNRKGEEGLMQDPGLQLTLDWRKKSKPNAAWSRRYHSEFDTAIAYLDESRAAQEARLAEAERRRQEELERERREMEQTRAFAEQQARSARRLRWAAAAMAFLFFLSLGAAGYAVNKRRQAHDSLEAARRSEAAALKASQLADDARKDAEKDRDRARKAELDALGLQNALRKKVQELEDAQTRTREQADIAADRARQAETQKKNALAERDKADRSRVEAESAKDTAEAAKAVGDMVKLGLEAVGNNDLETAFESFDALVEGLRPAYEAGTQTKLSAVDSIPVQYGWALSNRAVVQRQMGKLPEAKESYEQAREILEGALQKDGSQKETAMPLLFRTYHGLGLTYQDIALEGVEGGREIDPDKYFVKAEMTFKDVLRAVETPPKAKPDETEGVVFEELAAGHLELAHLYVNMGRTEDAEGHLVKLLEVRKKYGPVGEVVAARKELAAFYSDQDLSDPSLFKSAESSYNDLIAEQEKAVKDEDDHVRKGPELADSYYELAEVYRSQGGKEEKAKADEAFAAATAIQRLTVSLRRLQSASDSDAKVDAADPADAAADAYARLGKFGRARALYEYALDARTKRSGKTPRELWKSYDRLTRLYREKGFADDAKAEEYNQRLIAELSSIKPNSPQHAESLSLCADIYAKQDRPSEARAYYENALGIYAGRGDWMNQNIVLYKLFQMYARQKSAAEMRDAARRRLELLKAELNKVVGSRDSLPRGSITLVSEYLNAVNAVALLKSADKDDAAAAAVYEEARGAYDFITGRIYNQKALGSYVKVLNNYKDLLGRLGKQKEAAEVGTSASLLQSKLDDINQEQQGAQQTQQTQSQPAGGQ